jgi:hypothetical protein
MPEMHLDIPMLFYLLAETPNSSDEAKHFQPGRMKKTRKTMDVR